MVVGRILGWILLAGALAVLGHELIDYRMLGSYHITAAGELWFELHSASLNSAQAAIQRYIHPALWDPVLTTVLLWPAWAILGAPGLALATLCRRRNRRRR